ncbi:MAG: hypothetical protein C4528_01845 [Gammaproteobacteria bacterium]|nr:MAG: hypothetical protein C4528_01845 [Gammaproteobacteria bacterium]
MKYALSIMLSFMLASCGDWAGQSRISSEIERQISQTNGQTINLSEVGGPEWERVCIFGPYSNNVMARKALGFAWDLEANTSIALSDSINVFVFVKGGSVVAYTEHSRRHGDFWMLSGRCFNRDRAILSIRIPTTAVLTPAASSPEELSVARGLIGLE